MTPPDGQEPEDKTEANAGEGQPPANESPQQPRDEAKTPKSPDGQAEKEKQAPATEKQEAEKPAAANPAAEKKAPAERPARPAREPEPKGPPRNPPPPGSINEILSQAVPGVEMQSYMVPAQNGEAVAVEVGRDDLKAVMTAARDDSRLDLTYLRCVSGIDWQDEGLEMVYHLWSFTKGHELTVKTKISYDDPSVPTVSDLFPAADWHEREARDMFGINFEGHPNLVPILLPEDMTDHFPLRKENPLQEIEEWQGENLREGAEEGGEE